MKNNWNAVQLKSLTDEDTRQQILDLGFYIRVFNAQNESNYSLKLNNDWSEVIMYNSRGKKLASVDCIAIFSGKERFALTKYEMKMLFNVMDNLF